VVCSTPSVAILTRPAGRNARLAARLEENGWQVRDWPALRIEPIACLRATLPLPRDYDLIVFVSGNAARFYLRQLAEIGHEASWPSSTIAATVGAASAAPLKLSGWFGPHARILHPAADSLNQDSEALFRLLHQHGLRPERVLLVRGTKGRDWLGNALQQQGALVQTHAVYRRCAEQWSDQACTQLQAWAREQILPYWLLTSAEGIAAVTRTVGRLGLGQWWARCPVIVTHPKLAYDLPVAADSPVGRMVKICLPNDEALFQAFVAA
jgi:uroporphyrinogen-III synthase